MLTGIEGDINDFYVDVVHAVWIYTCCELRDIHITYMHRYTQTAGRFPLFDRLHATWYWVSGEPSIWLPWNSFRISRSIYIHIYHIHGSIVLFLDVRCIPPHLCLEMLLFRRCNCWFPGASKIQNIALESTFTRDLRGYPLWEFTEINVVEAAPTRSIVKQMIGQRIWMISWAEHHDFACFCHEFLTNPGGSVSKHPFGLTARYLPTVLALVVCVYSLKITKDQEIRSHPSIWGHGSHGCLFFPTNRGVKTEWMMLGNLIGYLFFAEWILLGEGGSVFGWVKGHLTNWENWTDNIVF